MQSLLAGSTFKLGTFIMLLGLQKLAPLKVIGIKKDIKIIPDFKVTGS
jgi:hypothetical protein